MASVSFTAVVVLVLLVFQAMLAAAINTPDSLGLSKQLIGWMAIVNVGAGVLLNQLRAFGRSDERQSNETRETPTPTRRTR